MWRPILILGIFIHFTVSLFMNIIHITHSDRSNRLVRVIDMGVRGVSGVTFGGPKRNILFVLASSQIVNAKNFAPLENVKDGSSIYKVTGLCATSRKSTSFKIPTPCNGCWKWSRNVQHFNRFWKNSIPMFNFRKISKNSSKYDKN